MRKKISITILVLSITVFLGAQQTQLPYWQAMDGPWCAMKIVDMSHCYVDGGPPYPPPVLYVVNEDTCLAKTTDDGLNWEILPKGHTFPESVKCVDVHPTNPDIVYKGITGNKGETGIMRSTDGGQTWESLTDPNLPNHIPPSKLGIFRQNPDYLLLGTYIAELGQEARGVYKTTDGGNNWEDRTPMQVGSNILNITDFSFHPTMPEIVCFSASDASPDYSYRGVWKSEDFGETWTHIGRPDNMPFPEATCVLIVSVDTIYAGYYDTGSNLTGVQRTTDGGVTWNVCYSYELFFTITDIAVDSLNHDNIYASYGSRFALTEDLHEQGHGVIRSTDAGNSWEDWNKGLSDLFVHALLFNWQDPARLYAGTLCRFFVRQQGTNWIDRTGGMLRADVSNVFPRQTEFLASNPNMLTYAHNNSWFLTKSLANNATAWGIDLQDYHNILRGDTRIYSENQYLRKSTDGGRSWYLTDCHWYWSRRLQTISYSPSNPLRVYFGFDDSMYSSWNFLTRSYDGGETWEVPAIQSDFTNNTIAIDYTDADIIFIGDWKHNHGVWKSTNAGDEWTDFNSGFPEEPYPECIPLINKLVIDANNERLYAATKNQGMWRRNPVNPGARWVSINQGIGENKVTGIAIHPTRPWIVYASTIDNEGKGYVYISPNYGDYWVKTRGFYEPVTHNPLKCRDLAIDPNAPDTLYAATDKGAYYYNLYFPTPFSDLDFATGNNNTDRLIYIPETNVLHKAFSTSFGIYHSTSSDLGETWSPPVFIGKGSYPALALDKDGLTLHCVWTASDTASEYVMYSRFVTGDSVWTEPLDLFHTYDSWYWGVSAPSLAIRDSTAWVTWETVIGSDYHPAPGVPPPSVIRPELFGLNGLKFNPANPHEVAFFPIDSLSSAIPRYVPTDSIDEIVKNCPSVVLDDESNPHILWDFRNRYLFYYSGLGFEWERVDLTGDNFLNVKDPSLSYDGRRFHAVWSGKFSGESVFDIYYSGCWKENPWDTLAEVVNVSESGYDSHSPVFSLNRIYWSEEGELYSSYNEDFNWTERINVSGTTSGYSLYPQVEFATVGGDNTVILVWTEGEEDMYQLFTRKSSVYELPIVEANLGGSEPSIFTVERDGFIVYGDEYYKSVDYDSTELMYNVPELEPETGQHLELLLYHESNEDWKLRVRIDNKWTRNVWVSPGEPVSIEGMIPISCLQDGEINITIEPVPPTQNALGVCSALWLYDAHGGGGSMSSGEGKTPLVYSLKTPSPTPFKDKTTISYSIAKSGEVSLKVYDQAGRLIRTLENGIKDAGIYHTRWNGIDNNNKKVAAGVYFMRLLSGDFSSVEKLIIIR